MSGDSGTVIDREPVCGECLKYDQDKGLCKMPLPSWTRRLLTRADGRHNEIPPWRGISCCVFFTKAREYQSGQILDMILEPKEPKDV